MITTSDPLNQPNALISNPEMLEEPFPIVSDSGEMHFDSDLESLHDVMEDEIDLSGPLLSADPEELESMIAKAMHSLSFEEQRTALHDIHGVADIEDDNPEVMETKLAQLEMELCKLPHKKAYYMAKATSPAYVCDRDFRLLFLRSDNFKPRDAAVRLVRHFETKLELFGREALGRDIILSDLNELDMKAIKSGYVQWLTQRDRAGRAVLCWTPGSHVGPIENRFRICWWGMMNALRDKVTQQRGMVGVGFCVGEKMGKFDPQAAFKLPSLARSLPTRFVACHYCTDTPATRSIVSIILQAVGNFHQVRFRYHHGAFH
jgi:hypothetical protein